MQHLNYCSLQQQQYRSNAMLSCYCIFVMAYSHTSRSLLCTHCCLRSLLWCDLLTYVNLEQLYSKVLIRRILIAAPANFNVLVHFVGQGPAEPRQVCICATTVPSRAPLAIPQFVRKPRMYTTSCSRGARFTEIIIFHKRWGIVPWLRGTRTVKPIVVVGLG